MQFIIISCPSCPKHLASFRQSFPDKRGARWSHGAGEGTALDDERRSRWLWPEQRVCRGGFSSDSGWGVSCSLNRCCTWPCAVGACHNSGLAARTDWCWQAVLQAGGLRDEQGKPGVSPALRGLCGAVGTRQALQHCPRLILLCCSLPVPRSADMRLWGSAGIANRMRAALQWVAAVAQVQLTCAGSPGTRCSRLFHDRAW